MKKKKAEKTDVELLPGTYTNDFGVVAIVVVNADVVVNAEGAAS